MSKNWRKKFQLGRKQQHELGTYIRKRYYNLIGDNGSYHHKKVYAQVCPHDKFLFKCTSNMYTIIFSSWFTDVDLIFYRCQFKIRVAMLTELCKVQPTILPECFHHKAIKFGMILGRQYQSTRYQMATITF